LLAAYTPWKIGPQQCLFLRATRLNEGINHLVAPGVERGYNPWHEFAIQWLGGEEGEEGGSSSSKQQGKDKWCASDLGVV
jgi:hypothetical protein